MASRWALCRRISWPPEDLGGRATVTELAGYMEKDKSNMGKELAELVAKGAVARDGGDRFAGYALV